MEKKMLSVSKLQNKKKTLKNSVTLLGWTTKSNFKEKSMYQWEKCTKDSHIISKRAIYFWKEMENNLHKNCYCEMQKNIGCMVEY